MTEKNVNYTAEQVAALRAGYNPDASESERMEQVAKLAEDMGKSTRSVIAKLTTMKLYVAKTYKNKNGATPRKKEDIVSAIAKNLGVNVEIAESLEKANKKILELVEQATLPAE